MAFHLRFSIADIDSWRCRSHSQQLLLAVVCTFVGSFSLYPTLITSFTSLDCTHRLLAHLEYHLCMFALCNRIGHTMLSNSKKADSVVTTTNATWTFELNSNGNRRMFWPIFPQGPTVSGWNFVLNLVLTPNPFDLFNSPELQQHTQGAAALGP